MSRSNAELGRLVAEGRPLAVVFFRYLDERESLAGLSPRAPLPWMLPHEALEWLLATVDPALEPAP